jgi:hypothetical protein
VKAPVAGSKSNRKPMIYQQLLHRQLRSTVSHHGLKIVFTKNKTYSHQFYLELQKPENPLVFLYKIQNLKFGKRKQKIEQFFDLSFELFGLSINFWPILILNKMVN